MINFFFHSGKRPYNKHKAIHAEVDKEKKQFPCEQCGKVFGEKQSLTSHILRHIGNKPFTCEKCGKSFYTKVSKEYLDFWN